MQFETEMLLKGQTPLGHELVSRVTSAEKEWL